MNNNCVESNKLFSDHLISNVDASDWKDRYGLSLSPSCPGEGLLLRPLEIDDYHRGFLDVLTELTKVGDISEEEFSDRFKMMKACYNSFLVLVVEDVKSNEVIGTATLVIEQKFIRKCATRGRIEDVAVSSKHRGKQLGKLLLATLTDLAINLGCYKISLECFQKMIAFYELFGFKKDEDNHYMVQRFKE